MIDTTWHYAVVVGIDHYPRYENGSKNLRCPLEDAKEMEQWLTSTNGGNVDGSRVKTLTREVPVGRNPPVPVADEIADAILACAEDFVKRRKKQFSTAKAEKAAWITSRLYFYVSGHGVDASGSDAALVMANATRNVVNMLSLESALNLLKEEKVFAELVVIADCCREMSAVAVPDLPWDLSDFRGFNEGNLPRTFFAKASRNRKQAFEPPASGGFKSSIFTKALLEGLSGSVPGQRVDSIALQKYLYNRVPELSGQTVNQNQHPEVATDPDIVFIDRLTTFPVTLIATARSAFATVPAVEACVISGIVIARHLLPSKSPGVFCGNLGVGFYAVVPQGADPFMGGVPLFNLGVLREEVHETLN